MKLQPKALLMAAVPVAIGVILLNNLRTLAGNTIVGKLINGDLVKRA